ncbi:MAG: hypothetical protein JST87_04825 [Bacteroidetes bacterium]|nr:hypothetical protein [Bacteroidota bacterium]MBS1933424.1 hypothetical protein [Bacteroidota bacterium]
MPTTLAQYYTDEIKEWNKTIAFHSSELADLTERLEDVIRRDSIEAIADKVEAHQHQLNNIFSKFTDLLKRFQQQEAFLKSDSSYIDDSMIKPEMEYDQKILRQDLTATEKECVDVITDCRSFLSEILRKKN